MIHSSQIRSQIKAIWPKCKNVWLTDKHYSELPFSVLNDFVEKYKLDPIDGADCEEYALYFMADFRLDFPTYPLGQCIARKIHGMKLVHTCNIAITNEGVHLIEPQIGAIRKPNPDEDDIFFIKL